MEADLNKFLSQVTNGLTGLLGAVETELKKNQPKNLDEALTAKNFIEKNDLFGKLKTAKSDIHKLKTAFKK